MTTALIIVDVQNDFCKDGALEVPGAEEIIPVINKLLNRFSVIRLTKDYHPKDHGSFAVNHNKEPFTMGELKGKPQMLWPIHCVNNSIGSDFNPGLELDKYKYQVIYKGTDKDVDSYSAFYDNNKENDTGLTESLVTKGITRLAVVGLATDYCVKHTVLDGLKEGFDVTVLTDGCRGVEIIEGDVENALMEMEKAGAYINRRKI